MTPNEIATTVIAVLLENCSRPIKTDKPITATEVNAFNLFSHVERISRERERERERRDGGRESEKRYI